MNKKIIPIALAVIVLLIIGGVFLTQKSDTALKDEMNTTQSGMDIQADAVPVQSSNTSIEATNNNVNNTPKPTTPPKQTVPQTTTTAPNPTTVSTPTTFTLAVVATHNTKSDCWSVVNGNVYNLTSWIGRHPGGQQEIMAMCGKDASAAFSGKHGGEQKPEAMLASFKIGTLSQ